MSVPKALIDELEDIWSKPFHYKIEQPTSDFAGPIFTRARDAFVPNIDFEVTIPKPEEKP